LGEAIEKQFRVKETRERAELASNLLDQLSASKKRKLNELEKILGTSESLRGSTFVTTFHIP
jgi:hypothetical protein